MAVEFGLLCELRWGFIMHGWVGWGLGGVEESLFLTPIMHCVAWDGHRRGHGDGSTAHGELVCDWVVGAAAAWASLARSCSWKYTK